MRGLTESTLVRALRKLPRAESAVLALAFAILVAVASAGKQAREADPAPASYSTYDRATGGYGAFYRLLEREGLRVDRFEQRPAFLGPDVDTLVWAEPLGFDTRQLSVTKADARALDDWVRDGGRLLYVGFDDAAAKTGLLALPLSRLASLGNGEARVAPALSRAGVRSIDVSTARRYVSRRGAGVLLSDRSGAVAVTYALGRGRVTALIDETLFTNAALARHDGARLAVALATPGRSAGVVSFDEAVHGYAEGERWWQILPRPLAFALLLGGLALALAFAGAAVRLGPPLPPPAPVERTTADFVTALASLFEAGRAAPYALTTATRSTGRSLARALGLGAGAPDAQIAAAIDDPAQRAAFASLVAAKVVPAGDRAFVRAMALAARLRKASGPRHARY